MCGSSARDGTEAGEAGSVDESRIANTAPTAGSNAINTAAAIAIAVTRDRPVLHEPVARGVLIRTVRSIDRPPSMDHMEAIATFTPWRMRDFIFTRSATAMPIALPRRYCNGTP